MVELGFASGIVIVFSLGSSSRCYCVANVVGEFGGCDTVRVKVVLMAVEDMVELDDILLNDDL